MHTREQGGQRLLGLLVPGVMWFPWSGRAGPDIQGTSHQPSQEQGSQRALGQLQPRASGMSLGMETGQGWAWTWACGWAWLGRAHGWAGQGCGELETDPTAAAETDSPRGLKWGPWPWAGWGQSREGWAGTVRPGDALRALSERPVR